MRRYTSILSLLVCVCGLNLAHASDCVDSDCDLDTEFDVLEPVEYEENVWTDFEIAESDTVNTDAVVVDNIDNVDIVDNDFCEVIDEEFIDIDYNCPFDTDAECKIWASKPIYNTVVAPRNPHLSYIKTDGILATLTFNGYITGNDEIAKPLLNRYLALMRASNACCREGIVHKMRTKQTKDKNIYNFLREDANKYALSARCMVMNDDEFAQDYSYGVTGEMVMDIRNSCICKNRQWIDSLLEPFYDLYQLAPDFEYMPFEYTYLDGFQREITVSINDDVHMVMELLSYCPD